MTEAPLDGHWVEQQLEGDEGMEQMARDRSTIEVPLPDVPCRRRLLPLESRGS